MVLMTEDCVFESTWPPPDGERVEGWLAMRELWRRFVQIRQDPEGLVRADESEARWEVDVEIVRNDGGLDFRGPGVHGNRGDRFIYLTWGDVGPDNTFEMFRRAKLMLDRVEHQLVERALAAGHLGVAVDLTDDDGGPRGARVDPPALAWSVRDP